VYKFPVWCSNWWVWRNMQQFSSGLYSVRYIPRCSLSQQSQSCSCCEYFINTLDGYIGGKLGNARLSSLSLRKFARTVITNIVDAIHRTANGWFSLSMLRPSLTSTLILHNSIKIRPINSQIHSKYLFTRCNFKDCLVLLFNLQNKRGGEWRWQTDMKNHPVTLIGGIRDNARLAPLSLRKFDSAVVITSTVRQVRVCHVKYVLDRVSRRDGYSIKNAVWFIR
jgi:hypothetical protein